ncbi:transporter substrate-binding domain-containing protein, partial [bacterium]|nr:transporter substrate-binding domain-containing protein [bacterium]
IEFWGSNAFEPMVIVNPDGTLSGVYAEFLEKINSRLGTRIRLRIEAAPILLRQVKKGEIDGILSIHPDLADQLGLLKSSGYFNAYPTVFASSNTQFSSPSDFAGKKVAIVKEIFFSKHIVQNYAAEAEILHVKTAQEGLQKIQSGEADFFVGLSANSYLISKYRLTGIEPKYTFFGYTTRFGMGIRSDWPELVSIMDKVIASFPPNEVNELVEKWVQIPLPRGTVELSPGEKAWLKQDHTIRVRLGDQAPYAYLKGGKPLGISVDFLDVISKRTGIKFQYVTSSPPFFADLQGLIQHTGPDLLPSLTPSTEREKVILFTDTYVSSPKFIFTRDDAPFVASMESLSGKTVAVVKDYLVHKELSENFPDINLLILDNNKSALGAVSSGKAFAFIGGILSTPAMINGFGFQNLKASAPSSLSDAAVAMGVRNDWPELHSILNKGLDSIPEAEKTAIINKWSTAHFEYGVNPADVMRRITAVAAVALGIIVFIVIWNRSLAGRVRERTADLVNVNATLEKEITERRQAEEKLIYQALLVENASDAVVSVDMDYRIRSWNAAAEKIYGWDVEEAVGQEFRTLTDIKYLGVERDGVLETVSGVGSWRGDIRQTRQDGNFIYVQASVSLVKGDDGDPIGLLGVCRDITEAKEIEEKLREYQGRLRHLSSQLTIAEEKERSRLAADLHDHVGQSLTFSRLQLARVRKDLPDDKVAAAIEEVSQSLLATIQDTRDLIFDLSSPLLKEVGLEAAINDWIEEQVSKKHGIDTELLVDKPLKLLEDDLKAILFRNVRELLTNVIKHAQADRVVVSIKTSEGDLKIAVDDDGIGFDPSRLSNPGPSEAGFGLFSIQERMGDFGGSLEITSGAGKGCRATLTVPMKTLSS